MFFWNKFCGKIFPFLLALFVSSTAYSQQYLRLSSNLNVYLKNNSQFSYALPSHSKISPATINFFFKTPTDRFSNESEIKAVNSNSQIIPADFSTCNYAFFCRQELKLEKISHLPLRIRLGSLAQCNYYEGKP